MRAILEVWLVRVSMEVCLLSGSLFINQSFSSPAFEGSYGAHCAICRGQLLYCLSSDCWGWGLYSCCACLGGGGGGSANRSLAKSLLGIEPALSKHKWKMFSFRSCLAYMYWYVVKVSLPYIIMLMIQGFYIAILVCTVSFFRDTGCKSEIYLHSHSVICDDQKVVGATKTMQKLAIWMSLVWLYQKKKHLLTFLMTTCHPFGTLRGEKKICSFLSW